MKQKRPRINIRLTLQEREQLEKVLNSRTSTRHDKLKAEVILLTDVGEYGPKISNNDLLAKLNISSRSLVRIRATYAKNSSIEDLFRFTGLSKKSESDCIVDSSLGCKKQVNCKYVEANNSLEEAFLIEHVKCRVTLTKEERERLETTIKQGKQSVRKFNRARILLLADEGVDGPAMTDKEISEKLDVSMSTVARVRRLLIAKGQIDDVLNFNHDKAGRPPKIDGTVQAALVAQACSTPPEGRCRWTVRLLADQLVALEVIDSISHTAIADALKKTNLNLGSGKSG